MENGRWTHMFAAKREFKADHTLKVQAGLHKLDGNKLPYFSVTADLVVRWRTESCGGLHREIAQVFPELVPVIAMHLSDSRGVPMHAEANGWYYLAGYYGGMNERFRLGNSEMQHWNADGSFNGYRVSTPGECLTTRAAHVRVDLEVARKLADGWLESGDPKAAHSAWIAEQVPRWQTEADATVALLDSLISGGAA